MTKATKMKIWIAGVIAGPIILWVAPKELLPLFGLTYLYLSYRWKMWDLF